MNEASRREVVIDALGRRGDGIAEVDGAPVYIAGALPGERVLADIAGERGRLLEVREASPDRVAPICRYFGECGGCATQHLAAPAYFGWKRGIVADALAREALAAPLGDLVDAHGAGRRRATFHARFGADRALKVGYMRARSHDIVDIADCPVLASDLAGAPAAARALAEKLRGAGKPLDIGVTATAGGLDIDIRGLGPPDEAARRALIGAAEALDLARLSIHGRALVERRAPEIDMGGARARLPPGAFLQATAAGENALASRAVEATRGAKRVADLFCGSGAIALRLAARAQVRAVDLDAPALGALARAAAETPGLRAVECEERNLFDRPLRRDELSAFDAVVFDPPRAGAQAQSRELAASGVATIVAISCDATTFARDARILVEGGYSIESVAPIDQFRYTPHIEIVCVLRRARSRPRKGRLLG